MFIIWYPPEAPQGVNALSPLPLSVQKDGERRGVKAKTVYPARPQEWTEPEWALDNAWAS